jgi:signal transduction histidine kinase
VFATDPSLEDIVETPVIFASVRDEGIGIPADELENIWHDFYQVDGSATRRFGGTGLGLALVRDIVHAHNGVIWAESQLDVETIVTFVIPRAEPE